MCFCRDWKESPSKAESEVNLGTSTKKEVVCSDLSIDVTDCPVFDRGTHSCSPVKAQRNSTIPNILTKSQPSKSKHLHPTPQGHYNETPLYPKQPLPQSPCTTEGCTTEPVTAWREGAAEDTSLGQFVCHLHTRYSDSPRWLRKPLRCLHRRSTEPPRRPRGEVKARTHAILIHDPGIEDTE